MECLCQVMHHTYFDIDILVIACLFIYSPGLAESSANA